MPESDNITKEVKTTTEDLTKKILMCDELKKIKKERKRKAKQIKKDFKIRLDIYVSDLVRKAVPLGLSKIEISRNAAAHEILKSMSEEDPNNKEIIEHMAWVEDGVCDCFDSTIKEFVKRLNFSVSSDFDDEGHYMHVIKLNEKSNSSNNTSCSTKTNSTGSTNFLDSINPAIAVVIAVMGIIIISNSSNRCSYCR